MAEGGASSGGPRKPRRPRRPPGATPKRRAASAEPRPTAEPRPVNEPPEPSGGSEAPEAAGYPVPTPKPRRRRNAKPRPQPPPTAVPAETADEPAAEPVAPQPVVAEPVVQESVAPEPVAPEPVAPEPVAPEPAAPEPAAPEPAIVEEPATEAAPPEEALAAEAATPEPSAVAIDAGQPVLAPLPDAAAELPDVPVDIVPAALPAGPARIRRRDAAMLVLAVAIAITALIVARLGVSGPPESFTQLWLQGGTSDAPLMVGIESHESGPVGYHLDLVVNGTVRRSTEFDLDPGAQKLVAAPALSPGTTFEARLALKSKPDEVYRRVLLHVPVPTPSPKPSPSG